MKPNFTTDLNALPFLPIRHPSRKSYRLGMPINCNASIIGLEPYYLAQELRELLSIFRTPGTAVVLTTMKRYRHVRLRLPCPVGPQLAHWIDYVCRVYGWDARHAVEQGANQLFELAKVVDPQAWQDMDDPSVAVVFTEDVRKRTTRVTRRRVPPATCIHGILISDTCSECEDMLPF